MNDNSKTMHAHATRLARKAMNDNINATASFTDGGDYGRAQADYARRAVENRDSGLARAQEHNLNLRVAAEIRKHGGYQLDMFPG